MAYGELLPDLLTPPLTRGKRRGRTPARWLSPPGDERSQKLAEDARLELHVPSEF